MFDKARKAALEISGKSLVEELKKKGYKASYVATKEEALEAVLKIIPENVSVGIPGSVTIREIGAMEALEKRGCKIYQHWNPKLTPEERAEVLQQENMADYFLTSTNAVTRDGMMVNIDGNGNRVSGMAWGRNEIIYVISVNKIAKDLDSAIDRARTATPPNVLRLNGDTPCTKTGYCMDCDAPGRVCRAMLILERPTFGRSSHVLVVGENLGY